MDSNVEAKEDSNVEAKDLQKVVQMCDLKKVNRELWIPSFQRKDFAAAVIRHWVFIGGKQTHSNNVRAENNF